MKNKIKSIIIVSFLTLITLNGQSIVFENDWASNSTNFQVGSTQQINWQASDIENLKIDYSTDGGRTWIIIRERYPAKFGYYDWVIPNTTSIFCKVRLSSINDPEISQIQPPKVIYDDTTSTEIYFTIYSSSSNWMTVYEADTTLSNIAFTDSNNGFAWGNEMLITTSDGGKSWNKKSNFSSDGAFFLDENIGWCFKNIYSKGSENDDSSFIFKTSDGGLSWDSLDAKLFVGSSKSSENISEISNAKVTSIYFIDENIGWIIQEVDSWYIGENWYEDFSSTLIYSTTDGGQTWSDYYSNIDSLKPITKNSHVKQMKYFDKHNGFILLRSTNNAFSFTSPNQYYTFQSYFDIIENDVSKRILSSIDEETYERNRFELRSFNFVNPIYGFITLLEEKFEYGTEYFTNYVMLKTKDGFDYIDTLYQSKNKELIKIYFYDDKIGWSFGHEYYLDDLIRMNNHFILYTTNGGLNWQVQDFNNYPVSDFTSYDGKTCWAIDGNYIIKSSDSISTSVKPNPNIDNKFVLNQNYPNPFNPVTNIEFILPQKEFVELNVYNILGQKVKVLVNEEISSGKHKIKFNAENLSSGIYFYQIKSKNYNEIKKMILLK